MARNIARIKLTSILAFILIASHIASTAQSTSTQITGNPLQSSTNNTRTVKPTPSGPRSTLRFPPRFLTDISKHNNALIKDPQMTEQDEALSRLYELFLHIRAYESYADLAENEGNGINKWMWRSYLARQLNITDNQAEIVKRYANLFFQEYADMRGQGFDLCSSIRFDQPDIRITRYSNGLLGEFYSQRDALLNQVKGQMIAELGSRIVNQIAGYSLQPHYKLWPIKMDCQLDFTLLYSADDPQTDEAISQSENDTDQGSESTDSGNQIAVANPPRDSTSASSSSSSTQSTYYIPINGTPRVCPQGKCIDSVAMDLRYALLKSEMTTLQIEESQYNDLFERIHLYENKANIYQDSQQTVKAANLRTFLAKQSGLSDDEAALVKKVAEDYLIADLLLSQQIRDTTRSLREINQDTFIRHDQYPSLKALDEKREQNFLKIKKLLIDKLGVRTYARLDTFVNLDDPMPIAAFTPLHLRRIAPGSTGNQTSEPDQTLQPQPRIPYISK